MSSILSQKWGNMKKSNDQLSKLLEERPYYNYYLIRDKLQYHRNNYEWLSLWDYKSNLIEE